MGVDGRGGKSRRVMELQEGTDMSNVYLHRSSYQASAVANREDPFRPVVLFEQKWVGKAAAPATTLQHAWQRRDWSGRRPRPLGSAAYHPGTLVLVLILICLLLLPCDWSAQTRTTSWSVNLQIDSDSKLINWRVGWWHWVPLRLKSSGWLCSNAISKTTHT